MFGKRPLFGNFIQPACRYCCAARESADGTLILCKERGVMAPYDSCRRFRYDPLRRAPARQAQLPEYDRSDFEL